MPLPGTAYPARPPVFLSPMTSDNFHSLPLGVSKGLRSSTISTNHEMSYAHKFAVLDGMYKQAPHIAF